MKTRHTVQAVSTNRRPFHENPREFEVACNALVELIDHRTKMAEEYPELAENLSNSDWISEYRTLCARSLSPDKPYKTTLVDCYSFSDIVYEAQRAYAHTKRYIETCQRLSTHITSNIRT